MAIIHVDTLKFSSLLRMRGFSEEQAGGLTEAVRLIDLQGVATKEDIQLLKAATKEDIQLLKASTKEDIMHLDKKLEVGLAQTKNDIMCWMFSGFFGVMLMLVGVLFKLSMLTPG